ncbi:hypothetical protein Tco_0172930 [Tanacetum coccineum]
MDHPPEKVLEWTTPEECREIVEHLGPPCCRMLGGDECLCQLVRLGKGLVRGEHAGCAEKLTNAERERDELRAVNADQVSQIKELEAELARKDFAFGFSFGCQQRLLGSLERMCIRRLSIPFNLAIQAGGARFSSETVEGTLWMYGGEKISGLPRQTVLELLKMYPAPPPQDAPTKVNPSSQAPDSSKVLIFSVPRKGLLCIIFLCIDWTFFCRALHAFVVPCFAVLPFV